VCVCVCVVANFLVVDLVIHSKGFSFCGVANGSSPGPDYVVETKQGWIALELALQGNNCKATTGVPMYILHAQYAIS